MVRTSDCVLRNFCGHLCQRYYTTSAIWVILPRRTTFILAVVCTARGACANCLVSAVSATGVVNPYGLWLPLAVIRTSSSCAGLCIFRLNEGRTRRASFAIGIILPSRFRLVLAMVRTSDCVLRNFCGHLCQRYYTTSAIWVILPRRTTFILAVVCTARGACANCLVSAVSATGVVNPYGLWLPLAVIRTSSSCG